MFIEGFEHLTDEIAMKFKDFLLSRVQVFANPSKLAQKARVDEHFIKLKEEVHFKEVYEGSDL